MDVPGLTVPVIVKSQLEAVATAARDAIGASPAGLDALHQAYRALKERVAAVAADQLFGDADVQWKEYSMLLGNDGAEGESVQTAAEAARLAVTTRGHVDAMQVTFGLAHDAHAKSAMPDVSAEFMEQLGAVINRYLDVQVALAEDDPAAAQAAAKKGGEALAKVDMELVAGENHMAWMKSAGALKTLLEAVATADGIEPARMQFSLLSEEVIALLTRFGAPNGTLYQAWCPMAFDDRGASWIQGDEVINNPYFGDMMLRCGEVREVIGGR